MLGVRFLYKELAPLPRVQKTKKPDTEVQRQECLRDLIAIPENPRVGAIVKWK